MAGRPRQSRPRLSRLVLSRAAAIALRALVELAREAGATLSVAELARRQQLPQPMLDAWSKELKAVLALPEVSRKLTELGLDVETSTSEEFHKRMMSDLARWKAIIDEIGYKPT